MSPLRSAALAAGLLAAALPVAAGGPPGTPWRVVAVGDIACDPADPSFNGGAGTATACRMAATSDLALALAPDVVLVLGDTQYLDGALAKYQASFHPSWGRLLARTRPVVGNHEYLTPGAAGYFAYFGAAAGDPQTGWYSFDLAPSWHVVALNGNCAQVGGCDAGSPQHEWLVADLAANDSPCTLAYWHQPRFSSSVHGSDATYADLWSALQAAEADLVLSGHDHVYERFAPLDAAGALDAAAGVRQIVAGTGGRNLTGFLTSLPGSEAQIVAFGVVALDLYDTGFEVQFAPVDAGGPRDSAVAFCRRAAWPPPAADFHTVTPCRLADTRLPAGASGGPALAAGETRFFPAAGLCDIPADATALAINVTAISPTTSGSVRVRAAGTPPTGTSIVRVAVGSRRASAAIVAIGAGGQLAVTAAITSGGVTHLALDVTGWFR